MGKETILIDTKQIDKLASELKGFEKEVETAAYHAINRTLDYTKTRIGRIVPKYYAVKTTEVKDSLTVNKLSKSNLEASITAKGHLLSFAHFPYTPKTPVRGGKSVFKSAVMVTIKKPKGMILSKKGFVATTGAKDENKTQFNVFRRIGKFKIAEKGSHKGELREMIAPIRTLSIPQMITNEHVSNEVMDAAEKKLGERFEHEINRAMDAIEKNIK